MKLTKRVIDALTYQGDGNARDVRWDDAFAGFGVRIYPTGKKAFVLSYRVSGRKRMMTLGAYGVLTLDQARDLARQQLASVLGGTDPLEQRKRAAAGSTLADLCRTYMDRHARIHKKSWREDQKRIDRHILPALGNRKLANIRREDVAALHARIGQSAPYQANRVVELISVMFELATSWGLIAEDHPNPARKVKAYREQKRDRWVTPEELPRLAQAIEEEPSPYARAALWLYLLTGLRKTELLSARWDHVDFERKEIKLADTKAGRVHYLPLSEAALTLLGAIPRLGGNPFIFPGKNDAPLRDIRKPWVRVRQKAGVEDVRLHDLRRTVGSWLAQSGNTLHLIGRILNHSSQSTTAVYARFGEDHVRAALEAHSKRIMGVAGKLPAAEVVALEQAAKSKR